MSEPHQQFQPNLTYTQHSLTSPESDVLINAMIIRLQLVCIMGSWNILIPLTPELVTPKLEPLSRHFCDIVRHCLSPGQRLLGLRFYDLMTSNRYRVIVAVET